MLKALVRRGRDDILLSTPMLSFFFRKRSVYLPTWKGSLVALLLAGLICLGILRGAYPFLAVSHSPDRPEVIVIDGWASDQTLEAGLQLAREHNCQVIVMTGVDIAQGSYLVPHQTFAHVGEASLEAMGAPADQVHAAPAGPHHRHRTFATAAAVYQWLNREGKLDARICLVTEGTHSRRSLAVYRKVFEGTKAELQVVAEPPLSYDPDRWWASSAGVKSVIVESIATTDEWLRDSGRSTNDPSTVETPLNQGAAN